MKIAPAGREETLVSRDASITVNLRLRMTAVKGFEAEESPLFQPRAYLFEWLLAARDVYRMGQDGDAADRADEADRFLRIWKGTRNIGGAAVAQVAVKGLRHVFDVPFLEEDLGDVRSPNRPCPRKRFDLFVCQIAAQLA